jgi:hypothetical protein
MIIGSLATAFPVVGIHGQLPSPSVVSGAKANSSFVLHEDTRRLPSLVNVIAPQGGVTALLVDPIQAAQFQIGYGTLSVEPWHFSFMLLRAVISVQNRDGKQKMESL